MQGKAWFLEGLILALTLIICWLALTMPPPCDYGLPENRRTCKL
jgi:hypothetical protein